MDVQLFRRVQIGLDAAGTDRWGRAGRIGLHFYTRTQPKAHAVVVIEL